MRTVDFDFTLPPGLIAQQPAAQRDLSRLLTLHRSNGSIEHRTFLDLPGFLKAGDVLVLNNSRVIPARLRGINAKTGGQFEILLVEENATNDWWVMIRPGKRAQVGTQILLANPQHQPTSIRATVIQMNEAGHRRLRFEGTPDILETANTLGEIPLPPYITRDNPHLAFDRERYQTVFAQPAGSIAAPTAGLHFTEAVIDQIRSLGVKICHVTLHVGLGTFAPVKAETLDAHQMHEERYELSEETARIVNEARLAGRRVIAVGTTSVRVLESVAANNDGALIAGSGRTRIFIYPPFHFKIVSALLTNFHLPRSTLLMLVSAFAAPGETRGREMVLAAYAEAIRERYRFFSYGDAMLIL
ncbi:MAG: tRNA preQ1(34) S-adenosylmethionine ribosyltransferase-isomerase QueA [Akkermansiaceae bacterium]|nr:tRNA preQ1(34) S-adenosylmethionine ribosyltransferase-isomerase QueA [Verrucomicrobiales bacterium]